MTSPNPDLPRVSVIMPVLDAADTLDAQLDALAEQIYPGWWELVIADNGCTDESMAIVDGARSRLPAIRVVDASARRGGGYARNRAADAAHGDILLACDADDVVEPGWIAAFVERLADCDLAGGSADRTSLNSDVVNRWNWAPGEATPRPIGGGNLGCWKTVWDALGGFDEQFVRIADLDFHLRAARAGYRIAFAPAARIKIRRRSTLRALARRTFAAGRGRVELIARHPSVGGGRKARVQHSIRNIGFVAIAWPAALVSPGVRGLWLRLLLFEVGTVHEHTRLACRRLLRRREPEPR